VEYVNIIQLLILANALFRFSAFCAPGYRNTRVAHLNSSPSSPQNYLEFFKYIQEHLSQSSPAFTVSLHLLCGYSVHLPLLANQRSCILSMSQSHQSLCRPITYVIDHRQVAKMVTTRRQASTAPGSRRSVPRNQVSARALRLHDRRAQQARRAEVLGPVHRPARPPIKAAPTRAGTPFAEERARALALQNRENWAKRLLQLAELF
jgi:hypothetical protein